MTTATVEILGVHPYADKFPMLPAGEHEELRESIRANGLRNPIVIDRNGLIIDGRNRYRCCTDLGVEPEVTIYDGDDIAEYVIDCNVTRRNMSTGARAMATALVLAEDGRRNDGRWKRGSVDIGGSANISDWQSRLKECGVILDHAPDLAEAVVNGALALDAAYKQAHDRRNEQARKAAQEEALAKREAEAEKFVRDNAPDLAKRVDGKDLLTYQEALGLWEQRNREEAARLRAEQQKRERDERELQQNREQHCQAIAEALAALLEFTYPEARHRSIHDNWPNGSLAVRPAARELRTPETIRQIAQAMCLYADELEQANV